MTIITGVIRVRDCCLFTWEMTAGSEDRTFYIKPEHCPQCIAELERRPGNHRLVRAQSA